MKVNYEIIIYRFSMLVILAAFVLLCYYLYFVLTPVTRYFEYSEITPVQAEVALGEYPSMISHVEIRKTFPLTYHDVLRCRGEEEDYSFYSQYETSNQSVTTGVKTSEWVYRGVVPTEQKFCFIDATITVHLPFGVTKSQNLQSEQICFLEDIDEHDHE